MSIKKLQCENCGGRINPTTMRCEYCGTQYERDNDDRLIRIETFQNPIRVYRSQMMLPDEMVKTDPNGISQFAVKQLAHNLADAIAENMEIHHEYDPYMCANKITARVRIVEPKHIF